MGRKTTVWIFQATNRRNLTEEELKRKRNFRRKTESLQITVQNNAKSTSCVKANMSKTNRIASIG